MSIKIGRLTIFYLDFDERGVLYMNENIANALVKKLSKEMYFCFHLSENKSRKNETDEKIAKK